MCFFQMSVAVNQTIENLVQTYFRLLMCTWPKYALTFIKNREQKSGLQSFSLGQSNSRCHNVRNFIIKFHRQQSRLSNVQKEGSDIESKELNHFGVIADLLQIGSHSSRFVPICSFWRLFTIKMIKCVKLFPFSF